MRKFEGFLKGINLGGWLSQFSSYSHEHFKTFITEKDIKDIANMGFDHVRVPVDYNVLEDQNANILQEGYVYLQNAVDWCKKYGIKILIDLHEVYGYSFDPLKKDMDRECFFYDKDLQERFFKLWETIATHFANQADIVAFELLNEVVLSTVYEAWNKVANEAIKRIRAIAKDNYIVLGGVCYNNVTSVKLLDAPYDDKIVYNFHCYDPLIFTHQKAYWVDGMPSDFELKYPGSLEEYREASTKFSKNLVGAIFDSEIKEIGTNLFETLFKTAIEAANKHNAPLYCGEYGVIELAPMQDALRWFKDINSVFNKYGIGRALWNYKGKDFGLVDKYYAPIKDELVKYL